MINTFKKGKKARVLSFTLAFMLLMQIVAPTSAYALTTGPTQPEFEKFTPIGTSDMVDLASGDFNYNIPIMDVGGYPLNLAYTSNVSMDQESSWVGLGWDLNVGQISRQLRGLPDDFDGDEMRYENNLKDNVTVGANFGVFATGFGIDEGSAPKMSVQNGIGINYNNYNGWGFSYSEGLTFQIADNLSVGMSMNSSTSEGATVSPSVSFSQSFGNIDRGNVGLSASAGVSLNSRKGISSVTLSESHSITSAGKKIKDESGNEVTKKGGTSSNTIGGSLSFTNASFTPTKRVGMTSSNYVFNLNIEGEIWGIEPGGKFTGYRTSQGIKESEKNKIEKAYGYENSYNATDNDILDFNREKDRTFSVYTTSLPVTSNTYDLYSIQGQGVAGMFRPYKGQVGYVYDNAVYDESNGGNLGVEIGAGGGVHFGVDISVSLGKSSTRVWRENNAAILQFEEKKSGNRADYEKVYFKNIGGNQVDKSYNEVLTSKLGGYDPIRFGISDGRFSRSAETHFRKLDNSSIPITSPIARITRANRGQTIQKLSRKDAENYGYKTQFSPYALRGKHDHHTAEIRIIQDGGQRYVYGRAAYNVTKKEVTFDVSSRLGDCHTGLVPYLPRDNSVSNDNKGDQYFNRITTPAYAHTYLLTSVLSSDYSDLTNNGPTDDDLGSYTKFVYDDSKTVNDTYKWRVPYQRNHANYDEGLRSSDVDNKGNYLYGEKELLYIKKIETKTHIAIFEISARKDGYGVDDENGGGSSGTKSKMYKLNKITLYSKPEYLALKENATPIKTAHFIYDYSLCQGIHNNFKETNLDANETSNLGGKLTLKKIYFTYGKSNMGMYTPYKFNYATEEHPILNVSTCNPQTPQIPENPENPCYDQKAYDTWGGYKPNEANSGCGHGDAITNTEFPYIDQTDKAKADLYSSVWHLKSIELPSGGIIEVSYESDDYQYVQDKEVMQMFQVAGVGNSSVPTSESQFSNVLYNGNSNSNVLYIKLNKQFSNVEEFKKEYIRGLFNSKIYFRFLLNMAKPNSGNDQRYDYVTGYAELDSGIQLFTLGNNHYVSLPLKLAPKGDGFNEDQKVHPISKAGWNFGRQYLNRFVYTNATDENTDNLEEIVKDIIGLRSEMLKIVKSPNRQLMDRKIASRFVQGKSWVRLMQPNKKKFGGGSRVKQIKMHDQWQVMTGNDNDDRYKQYYGQDYTYEQVADEGGGSSGVATYEPIGNKENPLVQPFAKEGDPGKLLAPESQNYIEGPFGESYFPAPKITYSRVTVKNLSRQKVVNGETLAVKKHATGSVVTKFYTSRDYPTIVSFTEMLARNDKATPLASLLNLYVRNHLTLSQGFTIHTNDMDGRMKSQYVYAEGQTSAISGVDYIYESNDQGLTGFNKNQGKLNNKVKTISSDRTVEDNIIGVDYEVVNDFRDNKSETETGGIQVNVATLPFTVIVVVIPTPIPSYSKHENQLRTAVTTKHIHTTGILREKLVFDGKSNVSTKNLAWDAETGEVLLTETTNDFDDKYYSFNFPAYWAYNGMAMASKNIGLTSELKWVRGTKGVYQLTNLQHKASDYLTEGDELWISTKEIFTTDEELLPEDFKAYVVKVDNNNFTLINEKGLFVESDALDTGEFTVTRSGHRNLYSSSMASVTLVKNPLNNLVGGKLRSDIFQTTTADEYKIINASAIEYSDTWAAPCECSLPGMKYTKTENPQLTFNYDGEDDDNRFEAYNPYKYNIKGNWRPKASHAYLVARNSSLQGDTRNTGYFNSFNPFYIYNNKWTINPDVNAIKRWKKASEVTNYNPFGFEFENKDALGRHSSALYGYNYRFPVAVAANTKYSELAFDSFEDYDSNLCGPAAHFNFTSAIDNKVVTVSTKQAHSGKRSLKIAPDTSAVIRKQVIKCKPE